MSHARIEEVSDSDPEIDDPTDYLPHSDNQIIRPVDQQPSSSQQQPANPTLPRQPPGQQELRTQADVERSRAAIKDYCMLYPCYFSSARTRAQGRRVSKDLAIPNPLAFNLLIALKEVIQPDVNRIHIAFEPDKTHPKDWSNPGRARIQLFDKQTHEPLHPTIKNKEHLFVEVAKWLKANPTRKQDVMAPEMRIAGLPVPEKFLETEIPIPKGWATMNQILPLHSPAVSGGGVRDDFFKEALEGMRQAQGGAGGGGGGGGAPDMAALQNMMQSMGGMGGMGGMGLPGMGGGSSGSAGKKKDKKKG